MTEPQYISIGEAAARLSVSIDTIRRWEAQGKLTAIRTPKGVRLFPLSHIEALFPSQAHKDTLSISQAASYLGVSAATLRRWDRQNLLKPKRTLGNDRYYDKEALESFIKTTAQRPTPAVVPSPTQYIKEKAEALSDVFMVGVTERLGRVPKGILGSGLFLILLVTISFATRQSAGNPSSLPISPSPQIDPSQANLGSLSDNAYETQEAGFPIYQSAPKQAVALRLTKSFNESQTARYISADMAESPTLGYVNVSDIPTLVQAQTPVTGRTSIGAGKTSVFIEYPGMAPKAKVFLTATSANEGIFVAEQIDGQGFSVSISKSRTAPVTFNWLVIEVN